MSCEVPSVSGPVAGVSTRCCSEASLSWIVLPLVRGDFDGATGLDIGLLDGLFRAFGLVVGAR